MSNATTETCQSIRMIDRKTEYVIEALIPCSTCGSIEITMADGELKLFVRGKDNNDQVCVHTWSIKEGVHVEGITCEYKNDMLYIRMPKSDARHPREIQYTKKIDITPCGCGHDSK